jgi:hypothetical protein
VSSYEITKHMPMKSSIECAQEIKIKKIPLKCEFYFTDIQSVCYQFSDKKRSYGDLLYYVGLLEVQVPVSMAARSKA